jgi:hypothetical protein
MRYGLCACAALVTACGGNVAAADVQFPEQSNEKALHCSLVLTAYSVGRGGGVEELRWVAEAEAQSIEDRILVSRANVEAGRRAIASGLAPAGYIMDSAVTETHVLQMAASFNQDKGEIGHHIDLCVEEFGNL